jgi:hypothetical protein
MAPKSSRLTVIVAHLVIAQMRVAVDDAVAVEAAYTRRRTARGDVVALFLGGLPSSRLHQRAAVSQVMVSSRGGAEFLDRLRARSRAARWPASAVEAHLRGLAL